MYSDVLLTVDYDRTLTDPESEIPRRNLDAIHFFMENGGSFTVNTGRSYTTFGPLFDVVPRNAPLLLYNGSAAWDQGEFSEICPLELDLWDTVDQVRREFPELNLEIQGLKNHYLVDEKPEFVEFYDTVGWGHAPASRDQDIGPFLKFALFGKPYTMEVATMFRCSPEEDAWFRRAEQRVREMFGDKIVTFRAAPRIIDVQAAGVSKLRAARTLQKKLGKKILVCAGDAENDISMLEGADYGFCPADAVVAEQFPNVCKCAEGAVADVIYKKIPEILGFTLDK